ncbi:nicotinamide riboside transporter PnuC [Maricaulis sp.]|uniref:nicotinamide riboside transporter PnuC n=1 Tax=Maricaulis sp. TaxID=1486257 RepID=UPI003A8F83AF
MGIVEWVAAALGVASVFLTIRQSIWCWPVGIAMTGLYLFIFASVQLYSDAGLQLVYIGLQLYGWWYWLGNSGAATAQRQAPVQYLLPAGRLGWLGAGLVTSGALGYLMATHTDAALPYWDASTTCFSLVAQVLLARKRIETWLVWIAVDFVSIGVYSVKGLFVTAGLYALFLGMACWGWREWMKALDRQQAGRAYPAQAS